MADEALTALGITSLRHSVVSDVPAATWEQAMVTGNGVQGAMALGRVPEETIVLNHAGLFLPLAAPFPTVSQAKILPELRQLIAEGKFQAEPGRLELLPALPKAWPAGRLYGLLCRSRVELRELAWQPDVVTVTLRFAVAQPVTVRLDGLRELTVVAGPATVAAPQPDGGRVVTLSAGRE